MKWMTSIPFHVPMLEGPLPLIHQEATPSNKRETQKITTQENTNNNHKTLPFRVPFSTHSAALETKEKKKS